MDFPVEDKKTSDSKEISSLGDINVSKTRKTYKERKDESQIFGLFAELIESFITSFAVLLIIYTLIAFPEVVSGASMEPTLLDGERILVEKVTMRFESFKRGDIIIFHPPGNDDIDYVKRVAGLPGDTIKISDCKVYITSEGKDFVMDEPYLAENVCTTGANSLRDGRTLQLSDNEFFVLGDNRANSADSRVFGPLDKSRIVGKVFFRFWPPSTIGNL